MPVPPAWVMGSKRGQAYPLMSHLAEHGWVCVAGDPEFIAITGGSAGGHLSSLAALTANVAEFQPGFETEDTRVQAAVSLYGVYDFVDDERLLHPRQTRRDTQHPDMSPRARRVRARRVGSSLSGFALGKGGEFVRARAEDPWQRKSVYYSRVCRHLSSPRRI